jgi:hypothetical protein
VGFKPRYHHDTMGDAPASPRLSSDRDFEEDQVNHTIQSTIPDIPDDISRWHCHIDLPDFGERLQAAANSVIPATTTSRYSRVSVLMLCWEDEDPQLPISLEVSKLDKVFSDWYGFQTEIWKIPVQNCHAKLNQEILDFVTVEGDPAEHLFIVYYSGYAYLNKARLPAWTRYV